MIVIVDVAPVWTSLEVTKLFISGLTPIILLVFALYLNKLLKKFEHRQWRNQKLIEKRLNVYDDIAPLLNDLLCYFTYVGNWKELSPPQIVNLKRTIDKKIYLAAPLFRSEFFVAYMTFSTLCYQSFSGWGQDAKLRTRYQRRKEFFGANWDYNWNELFSTDDCSIPEQIKEAYSLIISIFSEDIGLQSIQFDFTGRIPENIE